MSKEFINWNENKRTYARIAELETKLQDTDYKAIKYFEGQLSEEEYTPVKLQRIAWREEINSLEEQLK